VTPLRVRPQADRDLDAAVAFLLEESAPDAALQLLDEFEAALSRIAGRPGIGSPRYAHLLQGLRFWRLRRHPYLVFYIDQSAYIDVLRVLHASRDIPVALREDR
jgi:toxin ParE1/3/4